MCVEEYVSTGENMRRIGDDVSLISG